MEYNPLEQFESQIQATVDQAVMSYFEVVMDVVDKNYEGKTLTPDDVYSVLMYVVNNVELVLHFKDFKLH